MIRARENESEATIEMTPLIDMVFLLLIFFLVASTFQQTERELKIALPAATSAGPITASLREVIVNIDAEGTIIVSGRTMEAPELAALIENAVASNPEQKVTVRGDKATAYANIVTVLDVCKGAGIQEPYLDTVIEQ